LGQPRTTEGNFWHKLVYPNQVWLDGLYMALPYYMEYEVLYDDGKNMSVTPFSWLTDTDTIITNIYQTDDSLYRIIINKNNVNTINHGNYVGNVR